MDDAIKQALEIIKAQARVRVMSAEEMLSMVRALTGGIQGLFGDTAETSEPKTEVDPRKALREKSVTCLECGKTFKILTRRHLAAHGQTPQEYREKYGYKKNEPLVAKGLARERRKKMKEMELWTRRKGKGRKKAAEKA